jgi:hypothetical protein
MSYAYNCDDQLPAHVANACVNGTDREFARIRSSALISLDYLPTLMTDPTDATKWQDGIDAGKIEIIPECSGSFDPGDPKELRGYGERKSSNGPRTQKLVFFDPSYEDNEAFYNAISNITNKVPAWRTSSLVHISDVPATIFAKDKVDDDLEAEVVWEVSCTMISANLASKHDASALGSIFGF